MHQKWLCYEYAHSLIELSSHFQDLKLHSDIFIPSITPLFVFRYPGINPLVKLDAETVLKRFQNAHMTLFLMFIVN